MWQHLKFNINYSRRLGRFWDHGLSGARTDELPCLQARKIEICKPFGCFKNASPPRRVIPAIKLSAPVPLTPARRSSSQLRTPPALKRMQRQGPAHSSSGDRPFSTPTKLLKAAHHCKSFSGLVGAGGTGLASAAQVH